MERGICSTSTVRDDPIIALLPVGVYAITTYNDGKPLRRLEGASVVVKIGGVMVDKLHIGDNTITFFNGVVAYNQPFHLAYMDAAWKTDGEHRFDVYQML